MDAYNEKGSSWIRIASHAGNVPSTWWNSARWVASSDSFRNTRSIEKYRAGLKGFNCPSLYSIRVLTAVVWVRRMFFCASARDQSYLKVRNETGRNRTREGERKGIRHK